MITALKITYNGGSQEFYKEEILDTPFSVWKQESIQDSGTISPYIYETGSEYDTLIVNILHYYQTTKAKIETIKALTEEVTIYYAYIDSPTSTVTAILDPQNIDTKIYYFGEQGAQFITTLIYLVT